MFVACVLMACGILPAATPPRFTVTTVFTSPNCTSAAASINEVGDVLYSACNGVSVWESATRRSVELLAAGFTHGCVYYYPTGLFNNSRQMIVISDYLSHCGIGGSSIRYAIAYGISGQSFSPYDTLTSINGAGEVASYGAGTYSISPDPADWDYQRSSGVPGFVSAMNDQGQLLVGAPYREAPGLAIVDPISATTTQLQLMKYAGTLNALGWAAGTDADQSVVLWDGNSERVLGRPFGPASKNVRVVSLSNRGWILGTSDQGVWLWSESGFNKLVDLLDSPLFSSPLPPGTSIVSAIGFSQAGAVAVTLRGTYSDVAAVVLEPVDPPPLPDTVLKRDAPPEMDGALESADCDAGFSGWVINRDRPRLNVTVELYDGATRIIAANFSGATRSDGTHTFRIALPESYRDSQPHAFAVRFGGTRTIVSLGTATLTCAP